MEYFNKKVIWITGASSGIGEALAYEFAALGGTLVLSARRKEELERVASACQQRYNTQSHVIPLDLTQSDGFSSLVDAVLEKVGRIDILVNNGGISQRSWVQETSFSVDRKIMEVNFFGQVALTKSLLPHMIKQGGGQIAVMSSLTGKFGFPMRSAYAASKHALHGFFETVGMELKQKNIRVTMVCPGRIQTQISVNAVTKDGSKHGKMDQGQLEGMPADKCAQIISKALKSGKREIIIGSGKERFAVFAKRFLPGLFFNKVSKESPT